VQSTADVVIVGAGVIGCSTAYHLARAGITRVTVLEMDQVGSGTSGKSASMLSLQVRPDEPCLRMAQYSYQRYMEFEEELGVPIDFHRIGWVSLATRRSAAHLREDALLLRSLGVRTEFLTADDIRRCYPEIYTEDIALATWGPDDGTVDPHMIMSGYARRAKELGVTIRERVRATGLIARKGRVEGIVTSEGSVACRTVVNSAGPWAIEVGRWAGVEIPILNAARTVLVTAPFPDIPSDRPFVEDVAEEWYYRPEGPGILMGMGKVPTEELDGRFRREMIEGIIEVAEHRVPVLAGAEMLTAWTGIRPLSLDDRPILGPVAGLDGFVLNCGWGGTGIIQSPAAGQLVAEWIAHGRTSTFDIGPFALDRFQGTAGALADSVSANV